MEARGGWSRDMMNGWLYMSLFVGGRYDLNHKIFEDFLVQVMCTLRLNIPMSVCKLKTCHFKCLASAFSNSRSSLQLKSRMLLWQMHCSVDCRLTPVFFGSTHPRYPLHHSSPTVMIKSPFLTLPTIAPFLAQRRRLPPSTPALPTRRPTATLVRLLAPRTRRAFDWINRVLTCRRPGPVTGGSRRSCSGR